LKESPTAHVVGSVRVTRAALFAKYPLLPSISSDVPVTFTHSKPPPSTLIVSVEPAPEVEQPVPPKIFQFPAVGDRAPPESPVIVLASPVPDVVTKPFASTANVAESKLHKPILVASVDAMA